MSYIRERSEERTGFQISSRLSPEIDCQSDFVMVYGIDETVTERIKAYREAGYKVHLMTGIAWGHYKDYLYGEYDGRNHWDEAQCDRWGNKILHGTDCPYMVPTVAFSDYITDKLKIAVDEGVEAIHVEEPEFWDRGGYSEAFKREYMLYYRCEWTPPHESIDARYKCAKLKAYLYARTIERVSAALKEYAFITQNRVLRFYVPTHSLLNYTQWKIVSPEGKLADIPGVDGCIAQVWTGTSREKNWYNGVFAERTFETAYLEYGIMQELVKGTGRKMWFLHDPIEDNPIFDWNDYRKNYFKTVTASLLHPKINSYEICPWPNRVFMGTYPKDSPDAMPIPPEYATLLNNTFQTLGTIENNDAADTEGIGILMSDSQLYQRTYPDSLCDSNSVEVTGTVLIDNEKKLYEFKNTLFNKNSKEGELFGEFVCSNAFPQFFGLALPLLKYGLPVRPVLMDNARRYNGYLDDYKVLIMSYEFMKPDYPDINNVIANWVMQGGTLIYVGDGKDPYHGIKSWWSGKYPTPAEHLFDALGITSGEKQALFTVGKGRVAVWETNPAIFCYSAENAELYRSFVRGALAAADADVEFTNRLVVKRGNYICAAVLDESCDEKPYRLSGLFADMFTPDFSIITEKTINPGENTLLFDLSKVVAKNGVTVIGTSVRINEISEENGKIILDIRGAAGIKAYIRLIVNRKISAAELDKSSDSIEFVNDELSSSVLLSFENTYSAHKIILS